MLTWVVGKEDVDTRYSIQDLMKFSKKHNAKVIIRGILTLTNGIVTYIN